LLLFYETKASPAEVVAEVWRLLEAEDYVGAAGLRTPEGRATCTPFVRRRQFAAVAAATRARVNVGLRYTKAPTSMLLRPAKAPGQATHRLSLTSIDAITSEVERLLRTAYEQNG
jgi:hypothetical protein